MKKTLIFAAIAGAAVFTTSCGPQQSDENLTLVTEQDSVSYAYGVIMGANFKEQNVSIDASRFKNGMTAAQNGEELIDQTAANELLSNFFRKKQEADNKAKFGDNEAKGKEFLAQKAQEDGVQITASGLQYKVIEEGNGASPTAQDQVTVHYRGTLIDGTQFDSSYDRGEPATFPVGGVIPGWTEALQLMKEGAKYELYIPYELAYGERGAGQQIPPYATLIFEVELLKVN